jgi:DNA-binding NarL/FixJ family response regulator
MRRRLSVVVLSNQVIFREALVLVLRRAGFSNISELAGRRALLDDVQAKKPDLIVVDLDHTDEDTSTLVGSLRRDFPGTGVVALGTPLRQGAAPVAQPGISTPREGLAALVDALEADDSPRRHPAAVMRQLAIWTQVTPRQRDVLRWLETGASNAQIARKLRIGERAVKAHVSALMALLGVNNRTELALLADRAGLRPPGRALRA